MVDTISADGSRLYCGSFGGILGTALAKVEVPPELYRVTCLSGLIARPKSDGGSVAPAVSLYLRQSVSPRLANFCRRSSPRLILEKTYASFCRALSFTMKQLQQLRQLGDVRRNPPRLVFGEEPPCNVLLIRRGVD